MDFKLERTLASRNKMLEQYHNAPRAIAPGGRHDMRETEGTFRPKSQESDSPSDLDRMFEEDAFRPKSQESVSANPHLLPPSDLDRRLMKVALPKKHGDGSEGQM